MKAAATIGERGRRFTLDVPVEAPDGFGGAVRSYAPGPLLWGSLEMLTLGERLRAGRGEAVVTHRVTLPYRESLDDTHRLSLGQRRFRIRAASDPDGTKRRLVCLVEEVRA